MGMESIFGAFGGTSEGTQEKEDGEYIDGYKVATQDDMEFLAKLL